MVGGDPEKTSVEPSTRTSSRGDSSDENTVAHQNKNEGVLTETASEDVTDLKKLDSKVVQVDLVKDEDEAFKHLPPAEAEILKRQVFVPTVKAGFATLYRYGTRNDFIIMGVSGICSIAGGAALPLMTVC
jgi:ATP-binding cassette subfamily B (MDR/TAP) protein 1